MVIYSRDGNNSYQNRRDYQWKVNNIKHVLVLFLIIEDVHMHDIINTTDGKKVDGYDEYVVFEDGTIYNTT